MSSICFDWLTFSTKIHSVDCIIDLLGLGSVTWLSELGRYGYKDCMFFNHISILYNGNDDMGVCVDMSGQGCRAFEYYGNGEWNSLFIELLCSPDDINITRLDVAYDDKDGILNIDDICNDTREQNFISKFRQYQVIYSNGGDSVVFGSRSSDVLIRIYDKQAEQNSKGIEFNGHWVRVELQLRRDRASVFLKSIVLLVII